MDTQNMLNATIKNGHGWIQNTISEVENTLSYLRGLQKQYKEEQERADALGTSCILVNDVWKDQGDYQLHGTHGRLGLSAGVLRDFVTPMFKQESHDSNGGTWPAHCEPEGISRHCQKRLRYFGLWPFLADA